MDGKVDLRFMEFLNRNSDNIQALTIGFMLLVFLSFIPIFAFLFIAVFVMFSLVGANRILGQIQIEMFILPCFMFWVALGVLAYYFLRSLAGRGIEVKLEKTSYTLGEPISGTITVKKDFKKQARSLKVLFYGLERQGKRSSKVCPSEMLLSGARTFRKGETIPFTMKMPAEAKDYVSPPDWGNSISSAFGLSSYVVSWNIEAKFDVPGDIDVSNAVMLWITSAGEKPPEASQG